MDTERMASRRRKAAAPSRDWRGLRCRHRLPSPEAAGYCDRLDQLTGEVVSGWDALREAARRHPDVRPCPRHRGSRGTWNWIERMACARCPDAVEEDAA